MNDIMEQGLYKYLKSTELEKIKNTKILIAGSGGLGSNAAMMLVRCGFEQLTLIDYDDIEPSNLNRQYFFSDQVGQAKVIALQENLLRINPNLKLTIIKDKLNIDNVNTFIENQDIILEAFDDVNAKKTIVEACHNFSKYIIAVSGLAGVGNSDNIIVRRINSKFYIVGDFKSDINLNLPPMAPRVMIAAAKQVDIILSIVIGNKEVGR